MASGAPRLHPAVRRRLATTRGRAAAWTLGLSALLLGQAVANTELDVNPALTGTPDLSASTTYTQGTTPATTSDLTFQNATYGTTAFTVGSALNIGTFNVLNTTQSFTVGGSQINLFGGTNSVAAANGGSAADLLYIADGGTLAFGNAVGINSGVTAGNLDVAGTASISGGLTGGAASLVLTKTGAGNLTLSNGVNTVTASNFAINAGTVTLTGAVSPGFAGGVLQNVSTITVGGTGATLLLNSTSNDVLGYTAGREALVINSGGTVLNNGAGSRVTLQNTVTMTGGTLGGTSGGDGSGGAFSFDLGSSANAINATSDASGNSALVNVATTLQTNTVLNVTRGTGAADLTFTRAISGYFSNGNTLTKTGNGILLFNVANNYTGTTTISGGTLQLGNGTTNGSVASNSIVNNAALVFANASNQTYAGVISGTGTVTVANASGVQEVLTGTNTYTGTTTINAGAVLQLGANATTGALSPNSAIVNNGTLVLYRSNAVVQGTDFSAAPITGTGGLTQGGNGTTTLNAANTYTGTTLVQGTGALILANGNAIQNSTLNGAVQFDQSVAGNAFTIGGLTGSTNLALANNAATPAGVVLSVGNNNASTTYTGALTGAGSLVKVGTGNLTLSGSTYTGTTTVNGGTLTLSGGNNAGGTLPGTPSITVNSGGTLALASTDALGYTTGKEALIINGTGVVTNTGTNTRDTLQNTVTMVGGTLTGTSAGDSGGLYSFNVTNGGLNATSDATGRAATISAPTVSLQSTSTVFNVTRGSAAPPVDAVVSSVIASFQGGGSLTKTGNGVLQLGGANTFTGGLTARAGTVLLTGSLASQALTLGGGGNGATFNYSPATAGSTQTLSGLTLAGGGNVVSVSAGNTLALGGITRNGVGITVNFNPAGTGAITTSTTNDGTGILGTYATYGSGTGLAYATNASGTVAAYTGGTTLSGTTLNGLSTTTNYNFAGSIAESANNTVNTLRYTGAGGDTVTIPSGNKLTLAGLMNAGGGTLTINGPTASNQGQGIGAGNGTVSELVVTGNTQAIVFNAGIVNNFNSTVGANGAYNNSSVTFATRGTVTLNNQNFYTGATTILSGTVVANATNALATTSGVAVAGGGILSLTANNALATPVAPTTTSTTPGTAGTAAGQVNVTLNGGTLLRNGTGVSLGTGTTVGAGALTLTTTATLDYGTTGVGTLNFNSFVDTNNFLLTVLNFTHPSGTGTGVDGTDDRLIFNEPLTAALLGDISFNGVAATQIALGNGEYEILPITAVPEPSTWVGGLLTLAVLNGKRLRRVWRRSAA